MTPLPAAPAAPAAATHTLFVRLLVRPGTGQLEQKRRTLALNATWTEVFDAIKAEGRHVGAMGALMKVEASFPPPIGDSEVDESEAVSDVLTCERVTLIAHQPGLERAAPRVPQLAREAVRSIPPFMHLGRKNLSNCYEGLVKMIEGEPAPRSLGFLSAETVGKKWMVDLNDIVFHTSPFHSKMASRGFRVPKAFNFAANIKVLEKQKPPEMIVENVDEAIAKLATLLNFAHMDAEPRKGSQFKVELTGLLTVLERTAAAMKTDSGRKAAQKQTMQDAFVTRSTEASAAFRKVEPIADVKPDYVELDATIMHLGVNSTLSTDTFEPLDAARRYAWFQNMHLTKEAYMISFDVGGTIGSLRWVVRLEDDLDSVAITNELEGHRRRLKRLVPEVHARVIKNNVSKRLRDIVTINKGAASYMYKLITGDESMPENRKEREAFAHAQHALASLYAASECPAEAILDLREHTNSARSGKSTFEAFWDVVHDVSDCERGRERARSLSLSRRALSLSRRAPRSARHASAWG